MTQIDPLQEFMSIPDPSPYQGPLPPVEEAMVDPTVRFMSIPDPSLQENGPQPIRKRTYLSPQDEVAFQQQYRNIARRIGIDPNPDDPRHRYDYRGAFKAGRLEPNEENHFPSEFKDPDHPNRFVNGVDTIHPEKPPPSFKQKAKDVWTAMKLMGYGMEPLKVMYGEAMEAQRKVEREVARGPEGAHEALVRAYQGFGQGVSSLPKSVAILAKALDYALPDSAKQFKDVPAENLIAYQFGDWIDQKTEAFTGKTDPQFEGSFAYSTLPQGAGSMAAFMAGGAAAQAVKAPAAVAVATLGAGVQAADEYQEAKRRGATEAQALKMAGLGVPLGATEALPLERILANLTKGVAKRGFDQIVKEALISAAEEGGQETIQQLGSNAGRRLVYDPNANLMDGVAESAGAGAILGLFANLGATSIGLRLDETLDERQRELADKTSRAFPRFPEGSAEDNRQKLEALVGPERMPTAAQPTPQPPPQGPPAPGPTPPGAPTAIQPGPAPDQRPMHPAPAITPLTPEQEIEGLLRPESVAAWAQDNPADAQRILDAPDNKRGTSRNLFGSLRNILKKQSQRQRFREILKQVAGTVPALTQPQPKERSNAQQEQEAGTVHGNVQPQQGPQGGQRQVPTQEGGQGVQQGGQGQAAEAPRVETPAGRLAESVKQHLDKIGPITAQQFFRYADEAYGGTRAEGKYGPSEAYDALEVGVNKHLLGAVSIGPEVSAERLAPSLDALQGFEQGLPTQTNRSGEKETHQQFSTPPAYAYLAAWAARIGRGDTVLEPSAGTGSLVAAAASASPRAIYANEISKRRLGLLRELGVPEANLTDYNAEYLNPLWHSGGRERPTVVVMNPPFSQTAGRLGDKKALTTGATHVEQALKVLKPGGRLVAIVGRGMNPRAPKFRDWWTRIGAAYNVRANIGIPGNVYAKYGTRFGTRLLVIDKPEAGQQASGSQPVVKGVRTLNEAAQAIEGIRNDRATLPEQTAAEPAGEETSAGGRGAARPELPVQPATGGVGAGESAGGPGIGGAHQGEPAVAGASDAGVGTEEQPGVAVQRPGRTPQGRREGDRGHAEETGRIGRPGGDGGALSDESVGEPGGEQERNFADLTDKQQEDWLEQSIRAKLEGKPPPPIPPASTARSAATGRLREEKPTSTPRPATQTDRLDDELKEAFSDIAKHLSGTVRAGVDPELLRLTSRALMLLTRKGIRDFRQAVQAIAAQLPKVIDKMHGAIEAGWESLRSVIPDLDKAGRVADVLADVAESEVENKAKEQQEGELEEVIFEPYVPGTTIPGAKPHPGSLVESTAMAAIDAPPKTYQPKLEQHIIEDGILSDVQLERVIAFGEATEQTLPHARDEVPSRRGWMDGDGTGAGKGRTIAGIMRDNWNRGRKRAVWVSEKWKLIEDARRDWVALGGNPDDVIHLSDTHKSGKHITPPEQGILFLTYDTLRGAASPKAMKADPTAPSRVQQVTEFFGGKDYDGVVIFDESHNMANAGAQPAGGQARNKKDAAAKALKGIELQDQLPNARVGYFSATGATEVSNLAYTQRLGLWGRGTAFPGVLEFIGQIATRGIAGMEVVSQSLKAMGAYLSAVLSLNDGTPKGTVTFRGLSHTLDSYQRQSYDRAMEAWRQVFDAMTGAMGQSGMANDGQAKGRLMSQYWGAALRFVNNVLTSMQVPTLVEDAKKQIAAGHAVVIQMTLTGETAQERAAARRAQEGVEDDFGASPAETLMNFINDHFPIYQWTSTVDDKGNERWEILRHPVAPERITEWEKQAETAIRQGRKPPPRPLGEPVVDPELKAQRDALLDDLADLNDMLPESPLDFILRMMGGPNAVAEITGRKRRFIIDPDDPNGVKRIEQKGLGTDKFRQTEITGFMDDVKRVLMFSEAGGTGASYHASLDEKNQRKRIHYLLQPGWIAAKALQGLGRTHRTNQALAPEYVLMHTDVEGQKRFVATIARRLGQLGALTQGHRETTSGGLFGEEDNMETREAETALQLFFRMIVQGEIDGITRSQFEDDTRLTLVDKDGAMLKDIATMPRFLNRVLMMPMERGNHTFRAFMVVWKQVADHARQTGTMDSGVKTLTGLRVAKEHDEVVHTHSSGAQTRYVRVQVTERTAVRTWEMSQNGHGLGWGKGNPPTIYLQSPRGTIYGARQSLPRTDAQGHSIPQLRIAGQRADGYDYLDRNKVGRGGWKEITREEAEKLWNERVAALPKYTHRKVHLVTGAILPIYDRLNMGFDMQRMRTADGEDLLGVVIPPRQLQHVLRRLGAGRAETGVSLDDLHGQLARGEIEAAVLANGWELLPRRVQGEDRIEISGPDLTYRQELTSNGVIAERVGHRNRYFIPTGEAGKAVLRRVVENRDVFDVVTHHAVVSDQEPGGTETGRVASWATQEPETPAGRKLLRIYQRDAKHKTARKGYRSIVEFAARGIAQGVLLLRGRSQTSKRNPAQYQTQLHIIRSRAPDMQGMYHEIGHALSGFLHDQDELWWGDMEASLVNLTYREGDNQASAHTAEEGIAELVRLYITNHGAIPDKLRVAFEQKMNRWAPDALLAMRDAHRAYAFQRGRSFEHRAQGRQNDRPRPLTFRESVNEVVWWLLANTFGATAIMARVERQAWFNIVGDTWHTKFDPGGVFGLSRTVVDKIYRSHQRLARTFFEGIKDTEADFKRAYNTTLNVASELGRAIHGHGTGLRVYSTGEGLGVFSPEEVEKLRAAGIRVPTQKTKHGEWIDLTDESFDDIVHKVGVKNWDLFEVYGHTKAEIERHLKKGHPYSGMTEGDTVEDVEAWVQGMDHEHPDWAERFKDVTRYMDGLLVISFLMGEKSAGEIVRIKRAYEDYWPLPKQMEGGGGRSGKTAVVPSTGIHRAFGSLRPGVSLAEAVMDRTKKALEAYYDNRLRQVLINFSIQMSGEADLPFAARVGARRLLLPLRMEPQRVATLSEDEQIDLLVKHLNVMREDPDSEFARPEPYQKTDIQISLPGVPLWRSGRPNVVHLIGVFAPGKGLSYYEAPNALLYASLSKMRNPAKWVAWLSTLFMGPTQPWKDLVTQTVRFALGNTLSRDITTSQSMAQTAKELLPGYDLAAGVVGRLKGNKDERDLMIRGKLLSRSAEATGTDTHVGIVRRYFQIVGEGIIPPNYTQMSIAMKLAVLPGQVYRLATIWLRAINTLGGRQISNFGEEVHREGPWRVHRKQGRSPEYAQYWYDKSGGQFSEHPIDPNLTALYRTAGFMLAGLNIMSGQLEQAFSPDPRHRMRFMTLMLPSIAMSAGITAALSILGIYAMYDDDKRKDVLRRLRERTDSDRLSYLHIFGMLRLPFDYGIVGSVASYAWNSVESWILDDPIDPTIRAKALLKRARDFPGPTDAINPFLKTGVEIYYNHKFFWDSEIVPEWMRKRFAYDASKQTWPDTPDPYKQIAGQISKGRSVSPLVVRYAIQQIMTRQTDQVIQAYDRARRNIPYTEPAEYPIIGNVFISDPVGFGSKSVKTLTQLERDYGVLRDRVTALQKAARPEDVKLLSDLERKMYALDAAHTQFNEIEKLWSQAKKARAENPPNVVEAKRLKREMTRLARRFLSANTPESRKTASEKAEMTFIRDQVKVLRRSFGRRRHKGESVEAYHKRKANWEQRRKVARAALDRAGPDKVRLAIRKGGYKPAND